VNLANEKASAIYFVSEQDFLQAHPFLGDENEVMNFIGAPVIEYGAFDPNAGDIYFIALVS
jgi:hypothetical protein